MIDVLRRETKFGDIENVADRAGDVQEGYTGLQEILDMGLGKIAPGAENGDSSAGLRGVFLRGNCQGSRG